MKARILQHVKLEENQFAYRCKRSTKDACISLDHYIRCHMEKPNSYARVLFVDYSSAFNTIVPSILVSKLEAGLLIDCFKTIEYFRFRFWSQNHCLFFFRFFFSKESKIYCISDCLRKGRNSAKSDCLVSTKNMTCFRNLEQLSRVPTKNDQYLLKEQR